MDTDRQEIVDSQKWTGSRNHKAWLTIFLMQGEEWKILRQFIIGSFSVSITAILLLILFLYLEAPNFIVQATKFFSEILFSISITVYLINVLLESRNVKKSHDIEQKLNARAQIVLINVKNLCLIRNPCSTIIDYIEFLKAIQHDSSDWLRTLKYIRHNYNKYSSDFDLKLSEIIIQNNFLFSENPDLIETLDAIKRAKFASDIITMYLDNLLDSDLRFGQLTHNLESIWRAIETHTKYLIEAKYKGSPLLSKHYLWQIVEMQKTSQQELRYWEQIKSTKSPMSIAFLKYD